MAMIGWILTYFVKLCVRFVGNVASHVNVTFLGGRAVKNYVKPPDFQKQKAKKTLTSLLKGQGIKP